MRSWGVDPNKDKDQKEAGRVIGAGDFASSSFKPGGIPGEFVSIGGPVTAATCSHRKYRAAENRNVVGRFGSRLGSFLCVAKL